MPTVPNADIEKEAAKADAEAAPAPPNFMDPSSFPDGGPQARLCLLGAFCAMFVSSVCPSYTPNGEQHEY